MIADAVFERKEHKELTFDPFLYLIKVGREILLVYMDQQNNNNLGQVGTISAQTSSPASLPQNPISASSDQIYKSPWPWWGVIVFSVLFGFPGSFFIVWQNLKRMGKQSEASKFLLFGGIITIIITAGLFLLPFPPTSGVGNGLAVIFPLWFHYKYFKSWQKDNPGKTKFSWSLVGWGLLGLILYLVLVFLVAAIFPGAPEGV